MPISSRFGADFFTVCADFSRFVREINGEKKISLLMIVFSRLVFHGLPPLELPWTPSWDVSWELSWTIPQWQRTGRINLVVDLVEALKGALVGPLVDVVAQVLLRGRQLGDGMGGGRNGCFWGAPILHIYSGKIRRAERGPA